MSDVPRRWTRVEVDAAVAKWKRDLDVATQNILELMDDAHYKWLKGDTDAEVNPALRALDELWQALPALNGVIDEVLARHANLPRFQASDELFEIQKLLEGESVKITTPTTYAQRGLLTPEEVTRAATPERVLEAMVRAYAEAKTALVQLGKARLALERDFSSADARIVSIENAFREAQVAYEERVLKVTVEDADALPRPFEPHVIEELRRWLSRLKETLVHGKWKAARVGFDNWNTQLEARLLQCQSVATENARPTHRRQELRGLLDSLRAKAVDTGLAEDPALAQLYREAHDLLYTRPTPMPKVEKLVSEYWAALR
jgi:hypothetical protein